MKIPRPINTLPSSLENLRPSYTKTGELNKDLCHKENNEVSKSIPVPITKSIKETQSNILTSQRFRLPGSRLKIHTAVPFKRNQFHIIVLQDLKYLLISQTSNILMATQLFFSQRRQKK